MTAPAVDLATDLVDLSDVDLHELTTIDHPVLAASARRVLADADRPQDIVAGFQSAI